MAFKVVGTVRDVEKARNIGGSKLYDNVRLYKADLLDPKSFDEPFSNCQVVPVDFAQYNPYATITLFSATPRSLG
jgi:hypothetical protein